MKELEKLKQSEDYNKLDFDKKKNLVKNIRYVNIFNENSKSVENLGSGLDISDNTNISQIKESFSPKILNNSCFL